MRDFEIAQLRNSEDLEAARSLLEEYARWIGIDLSFQDFERELAELPGDYAPPRGALLLARSAGQVAGCVALRPIDASICEMKRLYVREAYRASGAGRSLAQASIERARQIGYRTMRLDTLPIMTAAITLYRTLGFREIAPYRFNPVEGALYFDLNL